MKKIKIHFYYLKKRIKLYFLRKKLRTSDKGFYMVNYIINKYLLQVAPDDYNKEYEESINREIEALQKIFFELSPDSTPEEIRQDAAFSVVVRLIYFAPNEMREKIYTTLQGWEYLPLLKEYVKSGVTI